MKQNLISEKAINLIKEEKEKWKSIRQIRDYINKKLNINLTFHNVRDNIISIRTFDWKEEKQIKWDEADKSINKLSNFLKSRNITVKDLEKHFYQQEIKSTQTFYIDTWVEKFKIWVVSDTHLWAKTECINELHAFYKECKKEWITDILHAWDLCDWWWKVYPWQLWELKVFWFDDMLDYVQNNYPKEKWIKTHFILWNHDEDFLKHWWANFWKSIAQVRDDMNYLWFYDANIIINWIKIWLHHWDWWWAYATSYKLQKFIENLTWEMKPQLYILWHYHDALYMTSRNIHCFKPACFQKKNNFSIRKWLANTVWWFIIEITKTKNNEIRQILPKFIEFYF